MKRSKTPAPPAARPAPRTMLACLVLCALTLAAYSNTFNAGFALDNQMLLLRDPRIQQATAENVGLIWRHTYWWPNGEAGIYRPLVTLTYLFDYAIVGYGTDPAGYHWVNLFLHAANVLLVFALARRLFVDFRKALFTAALWAVHPVLTESVTSIVGRSDLLAGAAVLSGLLIYLKSAETTGPRRAAWLAGLMAATAVGAFSKESAVVLPGVIVLYELAFSRRWRSAAWAVLATLPPVAGMLWQRTSVLAASLPAEFPFVDNPIAGADFAIGRLTALKVLARYLWIAICPLNLSSDYSYSEIPLARGTLQDWLAWAAVAGVAAVAAIAWRRNRPAFFFACFAFLNLLPASNLLFPIGTIMAERLLYLPLVGIAACLVMVVCAIPGPPKVVPVVVCLIAGAFIARTWLRNLDWRDDLTMAEASVRTSPGSFKVHRLLAASLFKSDPARALAEAEKSVSILASVPDEINTPEPWTIAATLHLSRGDNAAAIRLALRSIAIEDATRAGYDRRNHTHIPVPERAADAYRVLAGGYLKTGHPEQALEAALKAKEMNTRDPEIYGDIADGYLAQSRPEDAAIALAEGMFATSNMGLRQDLVSLYTKMMDAGGDPKRCAVTPGPNGPALNPNCDIVRRDLCAAVARAHREDLLRQFTCPK